MCQCSYSHRIPSIVRSVIWTKQMASQYLFPMIQVVKMAEGWLSFKQRKFVLKWWWMVGKCALSAEMVAMWIWNSRQHRRSCCQNLDGLAQPSRLLVSVLIAVSCATKLTVMILNTCSRLAGWVSATLMRIMFCLVERPSFVLNTCAHISRHLYSVLVSDLLFPAMEWLRSFTDNV